MQRKFKSLRFILSAIFLVTTVSPCAVAGNIDLDATIMDLDKIEQEIEETHGQSYLILEKFGEKSKQEILENLQVIVDETRSVWDQDLDVYISTDADIEAKRKRLKSWVEVWRDAIKQTTIDELKTGIADALAIARADGLDVEKYVDIYDLMKKAISRSSFIKLETRSEIRDRSTDPVLDTGDYEKYIEKLAPAQSAIILAIQIGDEIVEFGQHLFQDGIYNLGERMDSLILDEEDDRPTTQVARVFLELLVTNETLQTLRERAKMEQLSYRSNLYKRAAIAFIRSLIYSDEWTIDCDWAAAEEKSVTYGEATMVILDCPESPTITHLRGYLDALSDIQEADRFALEAKITELIAEQELSEFIASFAPLVGEAIDIYVAFAGEDLAGYCVSGLERGLRLFFGIIPFVGPRLFKMAINTEIGERAFTEFNIFLFEPSRYVAANLDTLGLKRLESIAEYYKVDVSVLKQLRKYVDEAAEAAEAAGQVSTGAEFRRSTWNTVREQIDAEELIEHLPKKVRERAMKNADEVLEKNLYAAQSEMGERIAKSHMVPEHIPHLKKVADAEDAVIMYRSVNPDATRLIAEDAYTKWMNVKGKSADWGVQRGYIPRDQSFGKLGNPTRNIDSAKIKKFQRQVDAGLPPNGDLFGKTHLKIADKDGVIHPVMIVQKADGTKVPAIHDTTTGRYMSDNNGTLVDITENVDQTFNPEPFEVLADHNGNPLTADYDLLEMGFRGKSRPKRVHIDEIGGETVVKDISDTPINDPNRGYISQRQIDLLEKTNRAVNEAGYNIKKYREGEFVDISHHGPERGYPGTPGALDIGADPEITVFDPIHRNFMVIERCDYDCMKQWCRTTNKCGKVGLPGYIDFCKKPGLKGCIPPDPNRHLKDYIHKMRQHEYNVGPNSKWFWGHYNPAEGWSFLQFLANLKEPVEALDEVGKRMKPAYIPKPKSSFARGQMLDPNVTMAPRPQLNVTKERLKSAIMTCRERENETPGQ